MAGARATAGAGDAAPPDSHASTKSLTMRVLSLYFLAMGELDSRAVRLCRLTSGAEPQPLLKWAFRLSSVAAVPTCAITDTAERRSADAHFSAPIGDDPAPLRREENITRKKTKTLWAKLLWELYSS